MKYIRYKNKLKSSYLVEKYHINVAMSRELHRSVMYNGVSDLML